MKKRIGDFNYFLYILYPQNDIEWFIIKKFFVNGVDQFAF